MLASRARALVSGRLSPSLDDVVALAEPVLKHRMALTFSARADGETIQGVVKKLTAEVRVMEFASSGDILPSRNCGRGGPPKAVGSRAQRRR